MVCPRTRFSIRDTAPLRDNRHRLSVIDRTPFDCNVGDRLASPRRSVFDSNSALELTPRIRAGSIDFASSNSWITWSATWREECHGTANGFAPLVRFGRCGRRHFGVFVPRLLQRPSRLRKRSERNAVGGGRYRPWYRERQSGKGVYPSAPSLLLLPTLWYDPASLRRLIHRWSIQDWVDDVAPARASRALSNAAIFLGMPYSGSAERHASWTGTDRRARLRNSMRRYNQQHRRRRLRTA